MAGSLCPHLVQTLNADFPWKDMPSGKTAMQLRWTLKDWPSTGHILCSWTANPIMYLRVCFTLCISFLGLPYSGTTGGGLTTTGIYCLTVLEARHPRSRCQQDWFLLRARRENLSCVLPLTSGGLPAIFGVSQFLLYHSSLSLCSHVCVCGSKFYLSIRTLSKLNKGPILLQCDLILTNDIFNDPISR